MKKYEFTGENEHAKRYMAAIELAKLCIDLNPTEDIENEHPGLL
jgi:hypothetical protein